MTSQPGKPANNVSSLSNSQQPLPQSLPPTPPEPDKPTTTKKPRQTKTAESKTRTSAAAASPRTPQVTKPSSAPQVLPAIQPYPVPAYIMNPQYPMNGAPFSPQGQLPPGYPPPSAPANSSGQPQYAYPMHTNPYTPHYPYPPYPQQMMMYAPPRPSTASDSPQPAPSPVPQQAQAGNKRKRKSGNEGSRQKNGDKASDEETGASGSDARTQPTQQQAAQALVDLKKRTKTQRACDSCRSRKIRCDILTDSEPPACHHCKQYGFECTFFLPITETRFKKKKIEDEAAEKDKPDGRRGTDSPHGDPQSKREIGVFGPTSPAHILHSQASIPSRVYESYDLRYHHTWEVSKSGDGLIQVQKPHSDEQNLAMTKPVDLRIERDVVEKLVNAYFMEVSPMLPVITQAEFLLHPSPPPILLYSMCLVAAARREVPQSVFDSIRHAVNSVIKSEDVLSTPSIVNVQALLILCMTGDCHSQFVPNALSALWIRLGTAIRMAQDLGLHRAESVKQNIEMRRRLWGACVISDRWTGLAYGHPYMIDVQDCDARLPSSGDSTDLYMDELVRLSVLLGRVLKSVYSPSGLTFTDDQMLYQLLSDIEAWKDHLPDNLKYRGADSSRSAGLLHLLYACVSMMFWRVFMRISYICPAHLKFGLTVEQWSSLVKLTGEAIDWLDANERVYDVWLLVAYCATSCAFVQYHTWVRRKDEEAASKLRVLRDCVRRWEGSLSPDHMSARRKTAEIIALLYEATQGPPLPSEAPALNPTGGVIGKQPFGGLDYKKDPSRPGGGVFIARGEARDRDYKDLPAGTIINSSSSDDESEGEATTTVHASTSTNNDRASLFSPSAFAPPLPADDRSSYRGMTSAMRTPVNDQLGGGAGGGGGARSSAGSGSGSTSLVNFTPLGGGRGNTYPNVNPAMNSSSVPGNVQVMNVLDVPQASDTLQQFAMADTGFLEGIPGGMFDWGQWDTFFSRFNPPGGDGTGGGGFQQPQHNPASQQTHENENRSGQLHYS